MPSTPIAGAEELEWKLILDQIKMHFRMDNDSDFIMIKINKNVLRLTFENLSAYSPRNQTTGSYLKEIISAIGELTGKKFLPVTLQNDPQLTTYAILIMADETRLHRFDIENNQSIQDSHFKIKKMNLTLGKPQIRESQIINMVRDFYETEGLLVVGGVQDAKNQSQYNFLTVSYSVGKFSMPQAVSPYFLTVEALQSLNELETTISHQQHSVLQAVLSVKDGNEDFYYLIFKDQQYLTSNPGEQFNLNFVDESDLKGIQIPEQQKLTNILFTDGRVYIIMHGPLHGQMNIKSRPSVKKLDDILNKQQKAIQQQKNGQIKQTPKEEFKSSLIEPPEEKPMLTQIKEVGPTIEVVTIESVVEEEPRVVIQELEFYEPDERKSYILEYYTPSGPFKRNPDNASDGDVIVARLDDHDKIYSTEKLVCHYDIDKLESQQIILKRPSTTIQDLEQATGLSLEYIGIQDQWKLFLITSQQHQVYEQFLYMSMNEAVVPNCIYEVQFQKSKIGEKILYKQEYIFQDENNEIITYAVVVQRSSIDLEALLTIWESPQLSHQMKEHQNKFKTAYILMQLFQLINNIHSKGIYHGLIMPKSIFIDKVTYEVQIGAYSFADRVTSDENVRGYIIGEPKKKLQDIDLYQVSQIISLLSSYSDHLGGLTQNILSNYVYLRNYLKQNIHQLFDCFIAEEKYNRAFTFLIDQLDLHDNDYPQYIVPEYREPHMAQLAQIKNKEIIQAICKKLVKKYGLKELIQAIQQQPDCSLLFVIVQDKILNGETYLAIELLDHFDRYINSCSDIASYYLRIIKSDFSLVEHKKLQDSEIFHMPLRDQAYLRMVQITQYDNLETIELILRNLYNCCHPLMEVIRAIKGGSELPSSCDGIPEYFMTKLRMRFTQGSHLSPEYTEKTAQSINAFKSLRNLMQLMTYHNIMIPIGQYASPNYFLTIHRYILDLFSQNDSIHSEIKTLFKTAYEAMADEYLTEDIINQFTQKDIGETRARYQSNISIFSRFNTILSDILQDIQDQGDDQIRQFYSNFFNVEYYFTCLRQQLEDPTAFLEYLAMVTGLIETDHDKLTNFQSQFLN